MKRYCCLILFLSIILLVTGCKKKSDPGITPVSNNGFTLNGVFYSTPNGVYVHEGDSVFGFMFYSNSIAFNHSGQCWAGTGDAVEVSELIPISVNNHFPAGKYLFRDNSAPGYFTDGGTAKNYCFGTDSGYMSYCVRGNVSIVPEGSQFHFSYTFQNEDSTTVTGSFTGNPVDINSWIELRKKAGLHFPFLYHRTRSMPASVNHSPFH